MKELKHHPTRCQHNPCWSCHVAFMKDIEPLIKAIVRLYVPRKKRGKRV